MAAQRKRSWVLKELSKPKYRQRVERDKTKYKRIAKKVKEYDNEPL